MRGLRRTLETNPQKSHYLAGKRPKIHPWNCYCICSLILFFRISGSVSVICPFTMRCFPLFVPDLIPEFTNSGVRAWTLTWTNLLNRLFLKKQIMENTLVSIAVCNQKGGVGKSTFTVLLASHLHYTLQRNVLVVDCDYPLIVPKNRISNLLNLILRWETYNVSLLCSKGKYWDVKLLQQISDPTTKNQLQHIDI